MLGICSYVPEWTKSEPRSNGNIKICTQFLGERFLSQFERFLNKLYKYVTTQHDH